MDGGSSRPGDLAGKGLPQGREGIQGPSASSVRCLNYRGWPQDDNLDRSFAYKHPAHHCHPEADHNNLNDLKSRPKELVLAVHFSNLQRPQAVILSAAKDLVLVVLISSV